MTCQFIGNTDRRFRPFYVTLNAPSLILTKSIIPQGIQAQQKTRVGNIYLLSTKLLIWCYYRHIDSKQHNKDIILISKIIL